MADRWSSYTRACRCPTRLRSNDGTADAASTAAHTARTTARDATPAAMSAWYAAFPATDRPMAPTALRRAYARVRAVPAVRSQTRVAVTAYASTAIGSSH